MNVNFYSEGTKYIVRDRRRIRKLLEEVIRNENKIPGDLNFIVTDDSSIRLMNRNYLGHDYPTDVISFSYCEGNVVSGDIFIGLEVVRRNSRNYKVSLVNELIRIIVHGTLHLAGYEDYDSEGKSRMKVMEDYWLERGREKYGLRI